MASKERRRERRADRQANEEDRRRSVTDSRCPRLEQHKHRKWLFCPPVLEEGELSWALLVWNRPCAAARGSWARGTWGVFTTRLAVGLGETAPSRAGRACQPPLLRTASPRFLTVGRVQSIRLLRWPLPSPAASIFRDKKFKAAGFLRSRPRNPVHPVCCVRLV